MPSNVKNMATGALKAEFKQLAGDLSPINSRRSDIDKELKKRDKVDRHIKKLDHDEKVALYFYLKEELGY